MNQKLKKNIIKLMNNSKVEFFAGNIINKEFILKNDLPMPTMGTDGVKIYYTDDWINKLSDEEIQFSIVHEFYHIMFMHPHYVAELGLNPEVSNIAQDIVINALLQHDGIGKPPKGVITANYNGTVNITLNGKEFKFEDAYTKSFLPIYREIMDNIPEQPKGGNGNGNGNGNSGNGEPTMEQDGDGVKTLDKVIPKKLTKGEKEDVDGEINQINASGKMRGVDSGFARVLDKLTRGVVPWRNYIRPVIDRATAGFPTYSRPRRRVSGGQIIFPSIKRMGVNITVAIDTSGSIDNKTLSYFLGEIDNMMTSYPKGSVTVNALYHTSNVYSIQKSCKYMKDVISKVESGGTSHLEVFEKAEELKSKVLICLTDGYSEYPDTTSIKDVIFVCIEKSGSVPEFARRIDVDLEAINNG